MNRRQRSVVAGVHGLHHVERFFTTDFADDDAIRTHPEGVDDKLANFDFALAFDVCRACLHARGVHLLQAQFGGILNGNDALRFGNKRRQDVEDCGLARRRCLRIPQRSSAPPRRPGAWPPCPPST